MVDSEGRPCSRHFELWPFPDPPSACSFVKVAPVPPSLQGRPRSGYVARHVWNRLLLPLRERTARPCDTCGKLTRQSAGRCQACQRKFGGLCRACGEPAHVIHGYCPTCKQVMVRCLCGAPSVPWGSRMCSRHARYYRRSYQNHPEVRRILQSLGRPDCPCLMCGEPAKVWHHPDYGVPTWVVPLCARCHFKVHRGQGQSAIRSKQFPAREAIEIGKA